MIRLRLGPACLLLLLLSISCGGTRPMEKENISLTEWEKTMHVTFPSGTEALGLMKVEERDRLVRLKVSIPANSWPEFLKNSPIEEEDLTDKRRFFLGPDKEWWNPSKPDSLPTAQGRLENGSVLNVGVDQSNSERFTVYLVWHET